MKKNTLKQSIGLLTPPILKKVFLNFIHPNYGWFGNYKNWDSAVDITVGYDSNIILNKVKDSILKVKNGEAEFERDSVLFYKKDYSLPLLCSILFIANKNNNCLNIIDFGGSLGSIYFQYKSFFENMKNVKWNIIEQEKFVEIGKQCIENDIIKFHCKISDCFELNETKTIIISSTIQYLKEPYEFLKNVFQYGFEFILIDRTYFVESNDRITIQKVNPIIYSASYPCWFFNYSKFHNFFKENNYEIIFDLTESCNNIYIYKKFQISSINGYLFQKIK